MIERRKIGSLSVTVLGMGCGNFGYGLTADESAKVVGAAYHLGVNLFDTANIYGYGDSEVALGRCLRPYRDQVVIATKFGKSGCIRSVGDIIQEANASLVRLNTDYIDLYQLHEPQPAVHIDVVLEAFAALKKAGKIREAGLSNFDGGTRTGLLTDAVKADKDLLLSSLQNECSLLNPLKVGTAAVCSDYNIKVLAYSPLARGLLTNRPVETLLRINGTKAANSQLLSEENIKRRRLIGRIANDLGMLPSELALAWTATRKNMASVIVGASKPSQVVSNVTAMCWPVTDLALGAVYDSKLKGVL